MDPYLGLIISQKSRMEMNYFACIVFELQLSDADPKERVESTKSGLKWYDTYTESPKIKNS